MEGLGSLLAVRIRATLAVSMPGAPPGAQGSPLASAPTPRSTQARLAVGWVGGLILRPEVEPLGNVAKRAPDDASYDLGVFRTCFPDCGIHLASTAVCAVSLPGKPSTRERLAQIGAELAQMFAAHPDSTLIRSLPRHGGDPDGGVLRRSGHL